MVDRIPTDFDKTLADNEALGVALQRAARDAALTHARFGRAIPEWRDGKVVEVTPAEIFARYGLDENGRPLPGTPPTA